MKNSRFAKTMKQVTDLIQEEKWQEALDMLRLTDVEYPDTSAVLTAMGDCLIHLNKPDSAIRNFNRVTELEPGSVEAINNLGVAYMFAHDFDNSELTYLKALQFMPDHEQTLKNLAFLYFQQDSRLGDAATILADLVRKNPTDCEALYLMGKCYETGGEKASARLCFERILVHQPESELAIEAIRVLDSQ